MDAQICRAIREREILRFYYHGGVRKAEPFCYGCSTRGNDVLSAYQVEGYSASGSPSGWKLYKVAEMRQIRMTGEKFSGTRAGYNADNTGMVRTYCGI